ncbi:DUF4260 domain-containing protein [Bacillus albus]|uniref:Uncharacterized protein n=1 Tax=Bacillus albus TaxID=2026189 RepID=A0A1J9UTX4_9BACI|nr:MULTISPECIES: DUF4260 domain-containing protein [Bacillus]KMP36810.1 hypothetical protein TU52_03640 [Bacillus cereus]MBU5217872.1 DUF4260 domain-containing protein [Bacillus albus]MDA2027019.1 DUF4260 domain-containing protein [Bacillus cereus group sp. Bcc03]MDA2217098.1 DUF4260 domain-containing protein [Bacillus cereus group sp. Bc228]MDA2228518.1 DUF4260 domain-containing protein [Bacillus cereus group sp. Bc227]
MQKRIVHFEGLVVFLATSYAYSIYEFSWIIFWVFLLTPDLSMFAYGVNNHVGAKIYNICHTYIISIIIAIIGVYFKVDTVIMIGLIWTAHIGMDRMFGYGLKYETDFKDTHIQRL